MSSTTIRRSARAGLCMIILTALLSSTHAIAQAAVPISESGTHGTYDITDTLATPGARCRYEGTAGTWYLQGLHVRAPVIYGATAQLRSVGYRLLLQQRTADGWHTVQRGTLISGAADEGTAATLTGSTVVRDVDVAPNSARYRAALNLVWWDANAQVEGRVILAIENHRRTSDHEVTRTCQGRVPIAQ